MVEPKEGKPLVDWGTPQVEAALEASEWPRVYRERSEMQENSCKRMIAHGALNTNYGRKKIVAPDRHQQRAKEKLDQSLGVAQKRVTKKTEQVKTHQDKVAESEQKEHGTRLAQRQRALAVGEQERKDAPYQHDKLVEQTAALGPPGRRADRDFRQQPIMTCRTLLLENALMAFMALLLAPLKTKGSLDCLLTILFARSGCRVETDSQVISWINTAGLSVPYYRLLKEVIDGLGAMDLRQQGKPIRMCLKDMPP